MTVDRRLLCADVTYFMSLVGLAGDGVACVRYSQFRAVAAFKKQFVAAATLLETRITIGIEVRRSIAAIRGLPNVKS